MKLAARLWQNSKLNISFVGSNHCILIVVFHLFTRVRYGAFAESQKVSAKNYVSSKLLLVF